MSNYKMIKNINPNIYRGYDIRAIYGTDLNEDIAYTIGLAYGAYILQNGYHQCVIGHDNRESSVPIYEALVEGIISAGEIEVKLIGLVTTPMYYFAQIHLNEKDGIMPGIMITASHNPKEYNGLKLSFNDFGNACGQMIQDFRVFVEENTAKLLEDGEASVIGNTTKCEIREDYLTLVKKSITMGDKKIKVVVDTANGTASIIAKEMYDMFQNIELVPLYMESDSNFPNHHPDPSVESNNEALKKAVIANKADIGIGIDGDGDRVGVIDENGTMIYIDFFAIIIWRDIMSKVSNKNALFDVKCSKSLLDEIVKLGGNPVCYRTGNSYMKAKMREGNFAFGNELSGHVFFNDKWPNIDDGLYAGLRLIEILSKTDKSLSHLLDGVTRYYSTPEIVIKSNDDTKFDVIEKVKRYSMSQEYKVNDIDGVRVEFDNGWALVRASNTGPNITARFEGKTEDDMVKIQKEFMTVLNDFIS
ncbi:MAG: phosphomannomutase/phosphoglucomutase [Clostridia bacterium]|nr:phosphomannomutase/phosphoglucomutase [Clostridia bacterium]